MKHVNVYLFIVLLLQSFALQAVRMDDLYQTSITVPNESEQVQKSALRAAMAIVLVKLTGDRQSVNRVEFREMLNQAENYTRQYGYKQSSDMNGQAQLQFVVQFEENLINTAFRERGLVAWGKERPSVLLWLAETGFGDDKLLGLENSRQLLDIINQRSQRRGLGIIFPLLDLQDSSQIKPADISASNSSIISSVSNRYPADAVLAGTIESLGSESWRSQWTSIINDSVSTFSTFGKTREIVLQQGMDLMADKIANIYAATNVSNTASDGDKIIVSNVNTSDDYARALKYLRGLNTVIDVKVTQLESDKVFFSINSLGGIAAIYQAINLGNTLESFGADSISFRLLPD